GFFEFSNKSTIFSFKRDSEIPVVLKTRDLMRVPDGERFLRNAFKVPSNMAFISKGTPGRQAIWDFPTFTMKPGAVPRALGIRVAPWGIKAWFKFTLGQGLPALVKNSSICLARVSL